MSRKDQIRAKQQAKQQSKADRKAAIATEFEMLGTEAFEKVIWNTLDSLETQLQWDTRPLAFQIVPTAALPSNLMEQAKPAGPDGKPLVPGTPEYEEHLREASPHTGVMVIPIMTEPKSEETLESWFVSPRLLVPVEETLAAIVVFEAYYVPEANGVDQMVRPSQHPGRDEVRTYVAVTSDGQLYSRRVFRSGRPTTESSDVLDMVRRVYGAPLIAADLAGVGIPAPLTPSLEWQVRYALMRALNTGQNPLEGFVPESHENGFDVMSQQVLASLNAIDLSVGREGAGEQPSPEEISASWLELAQAMYPTMTAHERDLLEYYGHHWLGWKLLEDMPPLEAFLLQLENVARPGEAQEFYAKLRALGITSVPYPGLPFVPSQDTD